MVIRCVLFIGLLLLAIECKGLELTLKREMITGGSVCGILYCKLEGTNSDTFASSENPTRTSLSFSTVSNLTLFRAFPSALDDDSNTNTGTSGKRRELLVSVGTELPKEKKFMRDYNAYGLLNSNRKFLKMYLFSQDYCDSDFTCQARGIDSEGRELVSITNLVQVLDEKDKEADSSLPPQLLSSIQQTGAKMEILLGYLRDLSYKFDSMGTEFKESTASLEQRLENKFSTRFQGIDDQLHQLHSNVSALNNGPCQDKVMPDVEYVPSQVLQDILNTTDRLENFMNHTTKLLLSGELNEAESKTAGQERFNASFDTLTSRLESVLKAHEISLSNEDATSGDHFPGSCRKMDSLVQVKGEEGLLNEPFLCDMATQDGGWIVIQRRATGNVDFFRGWDDYKKGFGTFDSDFWLGNDKIHTITSGIVRYELRVDLEYNGERRFAHYKHFRLSDEANGYTLTVRGYEGNAGDSLSRHDGSPFTTKDNDQDSSLGRNCAESYLGAWWYINCHDSNLNGQWDSTRRRAGLMWRTFTGMNSATFSEMKIRPVEV